MKFFLIILCFVFCIKTIEAQDKFLTKKGQISFFSSASAEDIKADNKQVLSIINSSTGDIAIAILMKSFMFQKSLMQEHFNENYVESDKYPKAIFKGRITDFETISSTNTSTTVVGDITIHGVTKALSITTNIKRTNDQILLMGNFPISLADFDIKIPSVVINNIAETVDVRFELAHELYTK